MFKPLHALAQRATLMIVITAEGPELLRVNITPVQTNDKTKAHELRPLSLVGSPEELDADFAEAAAIWQAPKRSLLDQARDAATDDDKETGATSGGAKARAPSQKKPAAKAATRSAAADTAAAAVAAAPGEAAATDDTAAVAGAALTDGALMANAPDVALPQANDTAVLGTAQAAPDAGTDAGTDAMAAPGDAQFAEGTASNEPGATQAPESPEAAVALQPIAAPAAAADETAASAPAGEPVPGATEAAGDAFALDLF
jgi:PRTRC genetic system protein E